MYTSINDGKIPHRAINNCSEIFRNSSCCLTIVFCNCACLRCN